MVRGKAFQCEITVSSGVNDKLLIKHNIEIWELEEVIYDDKHAFSISHRDCYFVYGQTFAGRYLGGTRQSSLPRRSPQTWAGGWA